MLQANYLKQSKATEAVAIKRAVAPLEEAAAKERQLSTLKHGKESRGAKLAPQNKGKTRDKVAQATGKKVIRRRGRRGNLRAPSLGSAARAKRVCLALAEKASVNYETVKQYGSVCRAFELCDRSHDLTFSHHLRVMAAPAEERQSWLQRALDNDWSANQLRAAIKQGAAFQRKASDAAGRAS